MEIVGKGVTSRVLSHLIASISPNSFVVVGGLVPLMSTVERMYASSPAIARK